MVHIWFHITFTDESAEVPFEFYLAQDYAVDMYFLMDLSNTMKIHIERLADVSKQLGE